MYRYLFLFPFLFVLSSPAQKPPKKAKNAPKPCKIVMFSSQPSVHTYALVIEADGTYKRYEDASVSELKEMPECSDAPTEPSQRSSTSTGSLKAGKITS